LQHICGGDSDGPETRLQSKKMATVRSEFFRKDPVINRHYEWSGQQGTWNAINISRNVQGIPISDWQHFYVVIFRQFQ
jgi:hypothetical protein